MRINPNGNMVQQAGQASRGRESASRIPPADGTLAPPRPAAQCADRMEIPDDGHELAAEAPETAGTMSAERMAELRQRIDGGAYNSLEVVDQVARRLLDKGDV